MPPHNPREGSHSRRAGRAAVWAVAWPLLASAPLHPATAASWDDVLSPVPMREWTGLYGGFSAGAAWSSAAHDSSTINTAVFYQSGSAIGGTLGYNWQVGRFIVGLEADAAAAKIEGQTVIFCPATCFSSVDAIASLRPRLGIALGNFMPYVTFGVATALLHASQAAASVSAWEPGWTAGAGLEFRFAQNWSLKLEYLRVRMNDAYYTATINNQPIFFDVNQHDVNMVRFGINFFPDWYAPKPAR